MNITLPRLTLRWRAPARVAAAAAVVAGLGACSALEDAYYWLDDKESPSAQAEREAKERESGADRLFGEAEAQFAKKNFKTAATKYDEVERLYPTSVLAKRAILRSAESSYRGAEYDKAVASAGRYINFYPSDEKAPYAQYLIAVSHYDQITDVGRDQKRTELAAQSLRELISRYPASEYSRDAKLKLDLTVDHLAGKEMTVGRYYLRRGDYIAAINRFRTVVERYQQTSHTAEALHRLVESYLSLGVVQEAQTAAAVLGHNFPGSQWYQDSYRLLTDADLEPNEDSASWISRAWRSVTGAEIF
ncbi:MAG: outer membrane protein assembly factor BamD [Pseudomonadota bacterium]